MMKKKILQLCLKHSNTHNILDQLNQKIRILVSLLLIQITKTIINSILFTMEQHIFYYFNYYTGHYIKGSAIHTFIIPLKSSYIKTLASFNKNVALNTTERLKQEFAFENDIIIVINDLLFTLSMLPPKGLGLNYIKMHCSMSSK
jgi:hypothetical protein